MNNDSLDSNIEIAFLKTPFGALEVQADSSSILCINIVKKVKGRNKKIVNPHLKRAIRQLEQYLAGKRKTFHLPLRFLGPPFQNSVWRQLDKIPFGTLATYGEIAKKIGSSKASRAVGGANNRNPYSIVIPCHRVVGANQKLVGYGGGMEVKKWLLGHESLDISNYS